MKKLQVVAGKTRRCRQPQNNGIHPTFWPENKLLIRPIGIVLLFLSFEPPPQAPSIQLQLQLQLLHLHFLFALWSGEKLSIFSLIKKKKTQKYFAC